MKLKINNKFIFVFLICTISFLSIILRIYSIENTLPLDVDEYGIAYEAFSISTTGLDSWGNKYPIFFRSFGDYKLPFDIYFSALLFNIFEPSQLWLRFPAVIFGALYVPIIFLLIRSITKSNLIGLIGSLLVALHPHNFYFSQIISGSISASFFIFASLTFFIFSINSKKPLLFLIISIFSLILSLYSYPLSWIISPFLTTSYLISLLFLKRFKHIIILALVIPAFLPIINQFFLGGSSVRLSNTSAFDFNRGAFMEIAEMREAGKNDLPSRVFHNKGTTSLFIFTNNYLKHFNIEYLSFERYKATIQKAPFPPLYMILLPFYFWGIILCLKKFKNPSFIPIIVLLLASPLPSAITEGAVNSKRYLASMGLDLVFVSLGIQQIWHKKNLILIIMGFVVFIFEVVNFFNYYNIEYKNDAAKNFALKPKVISKISSKYWPKNNLIYTTSELGEPQIFPLVGSWYSTNDYLQIREIEERDNWFYVKPFSGLYYFEDMIKLNEFLISNQDFEAIAILSLNEKEELTSNICTENISTDEINTYEKLTIFKLKKCL